MHLSDAELGAALDSAGGGATGTAARAHAAACDLCADALRVARTVDQQVGEMLALLDHPAPPVDRQGLEQRIARSARAGRAQRDDRAFAPDATDNRPPLLVVERGARAHSRGETVKVTARRAAVILVLGAAVAAAAVPRSPVRRLLSRIVAEPAHPSLVSVPVAPPAPAGVAPVTPRGVAITSADRVDVVFQSPEITGELRIHPTLGTHVSVTASADGPTYTVGSATILVDSHDVPGVVYDIDLPPAARVRAVTIRVGDRVVFSRRGTVVQTGGSVQGDGTYLVKLGTIGDR